MTACAKGTDGMNDFERSCYEELYALIAEHAHCYRRAEEAQLAVWEDRVPDTQPLLLRCELPPEMQQRFPDYHPGEVHYHTAKMLLSGMKPMLQAAMAGAEAVPSIRANMGCGIFPSLFPGIEALLFDDGKMPWVVNHLGQDTIRNLREKDIALTDEFMVALEHMEHLAERIAGTGAYVYPLDLQGPFDMAHIIYGDQIFYELYDEPELIHHLLELCCLAIELGLTECLKRMPDSDRVISHYNDMIMPRSLGGVKISEDTSTLLSAEHIDEFVIPYMRRILDFTGGGYIHYCGRNDHLLKRSLELEKVRGINFGNPDKHDMDEVLRRVTGAGKIFYGSIQPLEGEALPAYFQRLRRAATVDGKCRLLLAYSTEYEKIDDVKAAWESTEGTIE